jgi:hypothetical protein
MNRIRIFAAAAVAAVALAFPGSVYATPPGSCEDGAPCECKADDPTSCLCFYAWADGAGSYAICMLKLAKTMAGINPEPA